MSWRTIIRNSTYTIEVGQRFYPPSMRQNDSSCDLLVVSPYVLSEHGLFFFLKKCLFVFLLFFLVVVFCSCCFYCCFCCLFFLLMFCWCFCCCCFFCLLFVCLFVCFVLLFFSEGGGEGKSFSNTIKLSNCLDPDQDRRSKLFAKVISWRPKLPLAGKSLNRQWIWWMHFYCRMGNMRYMSCRTI